MLASRKIVRRALSIKNPFIKQQPQPVPLQAAEEMERQRLILENQRQVARDVIANEQLSQSDLDTAVRHEDAAKQALAPHPDGHNAKTGEVDGPRGPEPTRYGDWERKGRVTDF